MPPWSQFLLDVWLCFGFYTHQDPLPLQCTVLWRGRNGASIHLLGRAGVKLQPSFSLTAPRHPSHVPCPPAELQPGRGRFGEKTCLPDVSSVLFKVSQSLVSAPGQLSHLLPSLPVPKGLWFCLSPAQGLRGSWELLWGS